MDILDVAKKEIEIYERPARQTSFKMIDEIESLRAQLKGFEHHETYVQALSDIADALNAPWGGSTYEQIKFIVEAVKSNLSQLKAAQEQEPVAYGIPNSAITGKRQPMMTLHHERCGQYPELMVPLYAATIPAQQYPSASDYEEVLVSHRSLVRELDVLLNGEDGAAKQASLCDIVSQVAQIVREKGAPILQQSPAVAVPDIWHDLKTDPGVFDDVESGNKTHEIRFNDRNFQVGDGLILRKTQHTGEEMRNGAPLIYTGDVCQKTVSHVLSGYGLKDGWVILSFYGSSPRITEQDAQNE